MAHGTPTAPTSGSARPSNWRRARRSAAQPHGVPELFRHDGDSHRCRARFSIERPRVNSPPVIVISEALARQAFPGENVLGKPCSTGRRGGQLTAASAEVIGIVKDAKYANLRGDPTPLMYLTFLQTSTGRGQMTLHVRIKGDPGVWRPPSGPRCRGSIQTCRCSKSTRWRMKSTRSSSANG